MFFNLIAFANSAMERIIEKRTKDLGRDSPCRNVAIQWGAIGDVGAFAVSITKLLTE